MLSRIVVPAATRRVPAPLRIPLSSRQVQQGNAYRYGRAGIASMTTATAPVAALADRFTSSIAPSSIEKNPNNGLHRRHQMIRHSSSAGGTSMAAGGGQQTTTTAAKPPDELNAEMAEGVQDAVSMLMRYGLGKKRLDDIAKEADKGTSTLLERWQSMMEAFLGTQVHVLAGLGYSPDEQGLGLYNQQLAMLMQTLDPEAQETIRVKGRDTWRGVLSAAFNIPLKEIEDNEVSIVDARNIMHKVSQKMMDEDVLNLIRKKCAAVEGPDSGNGGGMTPAEMQMRHTIVQEALINNVYLDGEPSLVSECGFGEGERAYVFMQLVMSEHQADLLVSQYVGTAMMEVLKAAGLDPATLRKFAEEQQAGKSSN